MLEIGSLVDGKYRVLTKIGQGGMSVVYLALNEHANKQWAIKEVRKDGVKDYEVVRQGLIAETDILKRLNHPHLPSIIDVIDREDTFLIVMDYIEGKSLDHWLKQDGAQPQDRVVEWAIQICDVLGYLHSRKPPIIYRDLKPANVMLKPDGDIMIIDFGTAREFKESSVEDTSCLGTQGYAAPEQYGGHGQTDARTDIYTLGTTMYHLLTGHNPGTPPYVEHYAIRDMNPALSTGLEKVILKCTQRDPAKRYQNCAELMYALEHYSELDTSYRKKQQRKWHSFLGCAAAAVICLAGFGGLRVAASQVTSQEYESYIEAAESASSDDDAFDNYAKAADASPGRSEAYTGLLSYYYSNNNEGILTQAEYSNLNQLLLRTSSGSTYESIFAKQNKGDYVLFCYNMGIYLYFNSNYENSTTNSATLFKKVIDAAESDSSLIIDSQLQLATRLYSIINNEQVLKTQQTETAQSASSSDESSDDTYTYASYWDDLIATMDDLDTVTNSETGDEVVTAKNAVDIYELVISKIYSNYSSFYSNGVTQATMLETLEEIGEQLELLESSGNVAYYTDDDWDDLYDALENAQNAVEDITGTAASQRNGGSTE